MTKIKILLLVILSGTTTAFCQTQLSLQQAKETALKNNTTIKNSELEIKASQEVKKNAFTNYFPKVSLTGFTMYAKDPIVKYNVPGGNLPVYDGNPANLATATQVAYFPGMDIQLFQKAALGAVNVTQPIFVGGKIVNGNKLAKLGIEIKEEQQKLSQNQILLKTEQQYWQIVSLQEKQKTIEKYEQLLDALSKQVNDAYKSGLVVRNDLMKVQIKQSELELNQFKFQTAKRLALLQLCQTIGLTFDSTLVLQGDFHDLQLPQTYFTEKKAAVVNRTEYHLSEQSIKAQDLQNKIKKGDYLPQLSVGVMGYYYNDLQKDASSALNGLVFATVSIPLSDWWGASYTIKEQKIKKEIAENNFKETKELLELQMENGWRDLTVNYRQIAIEEETLKQADENMKVNKNGYANGVITISDLLEAQALQAETANKLIDAQTQYKLAVTNYLQLMGK